MRGSEAVSVELGEQGWGGEGVGPWRGHLVGERVGGATPAPA